MGRGTLVHDSKSRERSTRALRSRTTTAVVLLAGGAVVEGQVIRGFSLSLELSPFDKISPFFPWKRSTYHEGYVWHSSI